MLVLSRQRDETIMIGDNIEITVVDIRGDKVRLGITAPKQIPVHRKEVWDSIQRENREAAQRSGDITLENVTGPNAAGPQTPPGGQPSRKPQRPPANAKKKQADANPQ
jgi:carbon storage regulator